MQPTTNAAAPRLHLLCSRSFFRPRPCEASRHDQLAAAATVCAAMHSARLLLLGQGHAATRGMRANEDGVAASLPVQSQRLHPSHCHTGAQRMLLWAAASAARRMPLRPCSTPAPPLHTPPHHLPPFPAWRACTPVTRMQHECSAAPCLSTPQRSTRGVAPRSNTAQAAKAALGLFQKTNEM